MPNRPPKAWWDKMIKEVKDGNPDYSDEQVDKTVGDIWYNKLDPSQKKDITKKTEAVINADTSSNMYLADISQFADSLKKLLTSINADPTIKDRAVFYIDRILEKVNKLQQAPAYKASSIQVTALDRSLFMNLHDDFKKSLQERVQSELKGELAKNPQANPEEVYKNIFNETYKYLTNLYSDALKSDIGQMQNSVMQEIKTTVQEHMPKPQQPGVQPQQPGVVQQPSMQQQPSATSASRLRQALEKNALIKDLYAAYNTSFDEFKKLAVTVNVKDVEDLINSLKELQEKKEQLKKEPITQDSVDQMQELINEQQGREPQ